MRAGCLGSMAGARRAHGGAARTAKRSHVMHVVRKGDRNREESNPGEAAAPTNDGRVTPVPRPLAASRGSYGRVTAHAPSPPGTVPPEIRVNSFLHIAHRDFIEYSSSLINCNTSRPWAFDFRPVRRKNQVWVNFFELNTYHRTSTAILYIFVL